MDIKYKVIVSGFALISLISCKEDDEINAVDQNIIDLPCVITEINFNDQYGEDRYIVENEGNNISRIVNEYDIYRSILDLTYSGNNLVGLEFENYEDGILQDDYDVEVLVESSNGFLNKIVVKQISFDTASSIYEKYALQLEYVYEDNRLSLLRQSEGYNESETSNFDDVDFNEVGETNYIYNNQGNLITSELTAIKSEENSQRVVSLVKSKKLMNFFLPSKELSKNRREILGSETGQNSFEYDEKPNPFTSLSYSSRVLLSSTELFYPFGDGQFLSFNNIVIHKSVFTSDRETPYSIETENSFDLVYNEFDLPLSSKITENRTYTLGGITNTNEYEIDLQIDYICD